MRLLSLFAVPMFLGLSLSFITFPSYSVQAATFYVDDENCSDSWAGTDTEPFCTIQKGIDEASSGDTVQVAAGTFYGNITMKSGIVLEGAGAGDNPLIHSIIDGGSAGSVVTGASEAKLVNFTITNGSAVLGAGLHNAGGMEVNNCIFKNNHATVNGGGVNVSSRQSVFIDCIFLINSAGLYGGGIYSNGGSQTLTNCSFIKNSAVSEGGGIYVYGASQTISGCSFIENSSDSDGGGIYNSYSSPALSGCTFSGNGAVNGSGGGIYNFHSSPTINDSVFSCNSAAVYGGGICNRYSSPTVINSTFTRNRGIVGGIESYSNCNPIITNCILWENSGSYEVYSGGGSTTTVTYSNVQGGFTGAGNINEDPLFIRDPDPGEDQEWGTGDDDYGDMHLSTGSPCIDQGDPSASGDKDMDGEPRIVDGDGDETAVIDMGADEFIRNEPFASFTASPNPAACNQIISFDASGSSHSHPQRSIVSYEWDWESDGTYDATGVTRTHAFSSFGSYTVKLRVTDDNVPPKTDTDTVVIDVNQGNRAPVSDADGPYISVIGADVPLDGSGSSDPDAGCGDSIVSYQWDLDNDGQFDDAAGAEPTIMWATIVSLGLSYPGTANDIGLRVTDSFGRTSNDATTLTIYMDSDGDGVPDHVDNCPDISNANQADQDQDDAGDLCDGCPADSNKTEPGICGCGIKDIDSDSDGTADCNDEDDDNDGMPDKWEEQYGLNTLVNDAHLDPDNDGYTNLQEYKEGGNPHNSGTPFPWEIFYPAFINNRRDNNGF